VVTLFLITAPSGRGSEPALIMFSQTQSRDQRERL
jgi:hypothetical protein